MGSYLVDPRSENAWQQQVKDKDLITAPAASKGDRYLVLSVSGTTEHLDQSQIQYDDVNSYEVYSTTYKAQVFKAGITGSLSKIILRLKKEGSPSNLIAEIKNIVSDKPGVTVHASQEISSGDIGTTFAEITITFSSPFSVTSGTSYSIVLHQKTDGGDNSNEYRWDLKTPSVYADGTPCWSNDSGSTWYTSPTVETYFKTYVKTNYWSGATPNDIAQYNGSTWDYYTPEEGWKVWIEDENKYYYFDGTNWKADKTATFGITIDNSDSVITTGYKGFIRIPYGCSITKVSVLGNKSSGSIVIDLWKCSYADYDGGSTHPVNGDSITASAPPTISSANKSEDSTLTGWTKAISVGEIIGFNVDSIATFTKVTLTVEVTKT